MEIFIKMISIFEWWFIDESFLFWVQYLFDFQILEKRIFHESARVWSFNLSLFSKEP